MKQALQVGKYIKVEVELDQELLLADQFLPVLEKLKEKVASHQLDPIKKVEWDNDLIVKGLDAAIAALKKESAEAAHPAAQV